MKTVTTVIKPSITESFVAVPDRCYEKCRKLSQKIGEAAVHQLEGDQKGFDTISAVFCDENSRFFLWGNRRHLFN